MTNTMTPSKIADWLGAAAEAQPVGFYGARLYEAAATIRELGARVAGLQETIKNQTGSNADQFARVLDRAEAAETNLKIATDALEAVSGMIPHSLSTLSEVQSVATQALARIEEVGA